jgi:hypothetical protein
MVVTDSSLPIGAQIAQEFAQGVHQQVTVDGIIFEANMDLRTGQLLNPASHLEIENAIKSSFQEGIVPQVTRTTVHGEAEV